MNIDIYMNKTGFESLHVYQLAETLSDTIWNIIIKWDKFSQDTVGKQWINSADSIGANIAEGTGRGRASLFEVRHWLRRAYKRNLVSEDEIHELQKVIDELTPRLSAYIKSIGKIPDKDSRKSNNK
jgi:four helix bundle protein